MKPLDAQEEYDLPHVSVNDIMRAPKADTKGQNRVKTPS